MLDQKIELLQQVPLLAGLPVNLLEAIAGAGGKRYFEPNENLTTEGEKGDTAFLILSGKACCLRSTNGELFTEDLWPGTLVGELGMLIETVHAVTVTASERLRALAISRDALRLVMEENPAVAQHISDQLVMRLHGLAARLREVDNRLAEIEKAA
jgi:CRP-like cAMP-binding protein